EILKDHSEGLIALSGCLKGEVPSLFAEGRDAEAEAAAEELARMFPDRFYLELMNHGIPAQDIVRPKLIDLGKRKGWPCVATHDVHYLERKSAPAQDALLCIQTGKVIQDEKRLKMASDRFYFTSPEEMGELFPECPEALTNTVTLASQLNLELDFHTYHFPKFQTPAGEDLPTYLERLSRKGSEERCSTLPESRRPAYEARLTSELKTIREMGFAGYFLIVADFIRYARSTGMPVGPGRGSAAGSLVAYCLRITDIDPLVHDLLFERFLNPERISMPDMDIDFCMRRRDEVIRYVSQKYGNVSQIITFGKMKARAVVRDVGRVMGLPYGDVDRIAKLIPATLGMTLEQALEIEPRLMELAKEKPQIKELIDIARQLEGFPRHASTHAAGVVISDRPLTEYLPLCTGQQEEIITQFDMKAVEKTGLIKFDFLGLKTLTVIDDAVKLIEKRTGTKLTIDTIPL
ncbi:MAG: DNA polymerase III subunit alpha, partial [Deltaproteobacteria bacterium]|nr:DNA polymerase III subunit alpha [Deltaproteobacteria bacterium]